MIKSIRLIDGDNFVVGNEFRAGVTISGILAGITMNNYTVEMSNKEYLVVPITSVLFARHIPDEEKK